MSAIMLRISSAIASAVIFYLTAKTLLASDFTRFVMNLGVAGIVVWACDFGSMSTMIMHSSRGQMDDFRKTWGFKWVSFFLVVPIATLSATLFHLPNFVTWFFVAAAFDLASDSIVALRQIVCSSRRSFIIQIGKKFVQAGILLMMFSEHRTLTGLSYFMVICTPSIVVLLIDNLHFEGLYAAPSLRSIRTSLSIWLQSGGTAISALDYWIVAKFGGFALLASIAISRKISGAISVIGAASVTDTLSKTAEKKTINHKNHIKVFRLVVVITLISILMSLFAPTILRIFNMHSVNHTDLLLARIIFLMTPIGIITANLNAALLGLHAFRYAGIATYMSSFVYLVFLAVGPKFVSLRETVIIAICANLFVELILEMISIRALTKKSVVLNAS